MSLWKYVVHEVKLHGLVAEHNLQSLFNEIQGKHIYNYAVRYYIHAEYTI
jgi:hypothetical protein